MRFPQHGNSHTSVLTLSNHTSLHCRGVLGWLRLMTLHSRGRVRRGAFVVPFVRRETLASLRAGTQNQSSTHDKMQIRAAHAQGDVHACHWQRSLRQMSTVLKHSKIETTRSPFGTIRRRPPPPPPSGLSPPPAPTPAPTPPLQQHVRQPPPPPPPPLAPSSSKQHARRVRRVYAAPHARAPPATPPAEYVEHESRRPHAKPTVDQRRHHRLAQLVAAHKHLERERIEALRLASSELERRSAAFHAALLHSTRARGYAKMAERQIAATLTKSRSVNTMASRLVDAADEKAKPPPPWAHECALIRGDFRHRSAPVLRQGPPLSKPPLTRAESAVLEQVAAESLNPSSSTAALLMMAAKYLPRASTRSEWTHWEFMQDRRMEQLRSGPGLAGGGGSETGLLAWGANL